MAVRCFVRKERHGMYVIQPLEGRIKHDCLIVNDTVKYVYDQVVAGLALEELTAAFIERARAAIEAERAARANGADASNGGQAQSLGDHASDEERYRFDLYRILVALLDRDICDYPYHHIVRLLPPGRPLKGTTQVMPMCLLDEISEFLQAAFAPEPAACEQSLDVAAAQQAGEGVSVRVGEGPAAQTDNGAAKGGAVVGALPREGPVTAAGGNGVDVFYSFPAKELLPGPYFDRELVARRHLDQVDVLFVGLDESGKVEACTAVQGLPFQPATLTLLFCAARFDSPEAFEERVGRHLARLSGLLQVTTLSAKIRFQYTTSGYPPASRHESYERVIGELGFRRAFRLPDEIGPGTGLEAYDRHLF